MRFSGMRYFLILLVTISLLLFSHAAYAQTYEANSSKDISSILYKLQPGDTLLIGPGTYAGNLYAKGLNGQKDIPITIEGKLSGNPPVFRGGNEGIHFSDCNFLRLRNLKFIGAKNNGVHIDDGGTKDSPSTNILLDGIIVEDTGPKGNHDAIKLSGVQGFVVRNCRLSGWGGSGIDCVGCSRGLISRCRFTGKNGFTQANGIQIKGGSHSILVEKCLFIRAGRRGINLGGSTGLQYFRPYVQDFEAKNIEVGGNTFLYGGAAVAFVTAQGGYVHHNAILYPAGWVLRILQETDSPRFSPCGTGFFTRNIVVVNRKLRGYTDIGRGTNPESFVFSENIWYDASGSRKPVLPSIEFNPVYDLNPGVVVHEEGVRFLANDLRLDGKGPAFYKRRSSKIR